MINDPGELQSLLSAIMADYQADRRFFQTYQLPEYVVLDDLACDASGLARFLTFSVVTNHIHNETNQSKQTAGSQGLWQVCQNLWDYHQWVFEPAQLVGEGRKDELTTLFGSLELMDNRDPEWWYRTADTLYKHWNGSPQQLLANPTQAPSGSPPAAYDAPTIVDAITTHDFPGLSGLKIRPLWLRLMHEEVHELKRIEEIPIPVDFHIVSISNRLRGPGYQFEVGDSTDRKTLRHYWQHVAGKIDVPPVILDKPLWLLHKYWDNEGEQYVTERLKEIRTD